MGSSSNHVLTFVLLIFSHNLIGITESDDSLINALCSKTEEPVFCKECLQADPSSKLADGQELALIAIGCAERDTTFLHDDTFNLVVQIATGKLKDILDDCAQHSFLAQGDFPSVARYVRERQYDSAKDVIAEVIIPYVMYCLKLFDQTPELPVPQQVLAGIVASNQTCRNAVGILSAI